MKYQTLLLDADETLLDFVKSERYALEKVFLRNELPFTETIYHTYREVNHNLWRDYEDGKLDRSTDITSERFWELFRRMNIDADGTKFNREYRAALGEGCFLLPGVLEFCQTMSRKCDLYIITNGIAETQHSRIEGAGLMPYLKGVFISQEIGVQKPAPAFFDVVFSSAPIRKATTLIVGDSLTSDIKGGQNAGVDTCWLNPTHRPLVGTPPTYEIERLEELYEII